MSLARLLTAAKALTTFNESPTAYRVRRAALLPKFGAPSNPFTSEKQGDAISAKPEPSGASTADGSERRSLWPWKLRSRKQERRADGRPTVPAKVLAASAARTPVQDELLLDNVKVVRNDLQNSDVDVVSRAGEAGTGGPAVAANLRLGALAAEKALDRLADRIVGAPTQ